MFAGWLNDLKPFPERFELIELKIWFVICLLLVSKDAEFTSTCCRFVKDS